MVIPRYIIILVEDHVLIIINAPNANSENTSLRAEGKKVTLVSDPYYLRLNLPVNVVVNEHSSFIFYECCDCFEIYLEKDSSDNNFNGLERISSLSPLHIPEDYSILGRGNEEGDISDEEDEENREEFSYGFGNKLRTNLKEISEGLSEVFELMEPEKVSPTERHMLRIQGEFQNFESCHYLSHYFDKALLEFCMYYEAPWQTKDFNKNAEFTREEIGILKELRHVEYMLSRRRYQKVLYGLVDILFGYCYVKRTQLESTEMSSWTINKLSSTLCCFCVFDDIEQVLIACYRRALCYPLFRNFDLCNKVKKDVWTLLKKGKKLVIKCMMEIHEMFNQSCDARYILNKLFIADYLVFLQKCRNKDLFDLYNYVAYTDITKNDLDLKLKEYEEGAILDDIDIHITDNAHANTTQLAGFRKDDTDYSSESSDSSDEYYTSDSFTEELSSEDESELNE